MKRSFAPSVLAAHKKIKSPGEDGDSGSDNTPVSLGRGNETVFEQFADLLRKSAGTGEAQTSEDEDETEKENHGGKTYYFSVLYSQRQSSRYADKGDGSDGPETGLVIVRGTTCVLYNLEAKSMGKASAKGLLKFADRGLAYMIGNKEVQV